MSLTQTQLASSVADRAELSNADAKRALAALEEIVLEQLGNAEKVRIGGMVQLTVRVKPAQKKRQGCNPATGEEITIAAKPASVDLRARPAKAKTALPSVQKARLAPRRVTPVFRPKPVGRSAGRVGCRDVENARRPRGASRGGQPSRRGPAPVSPIRLS